MFVEVLVESNDSHTVIVLLILRDKCKSESNERFMIGETFHNVHHTGRNGKRKMCPSSPKHFPGAYSSTFIL